MKILQINTRYIGGGGAATIANVLHKSINEYEGYESLFLYGRGVTGDEKSLKICDKLTPYISAATMRFLGWDYNKKLPKKVIESIYDADVIHLHNIHGYFINYQELIKEIAKSGKKVIWTLHDVWPITGRCAFNFDCNKWINGCNNCKYKDMYPKTYIDKSNNIWNEKKKVFSLLKKDRTIIVTPSIWLKDMVKKSYLKDYEVRVINNGVRESFEMEKSKSKLRIDLGLPIDKNIILFVAADPSDRRKGIKHIINLLDKVDENTIFLSVGKEMKGCTSSKLIQYGYVKDQKKLDMLYSASDVFVIPSLNDNFPTTVLESFRNGTPAIGFDTGGISEQIEDGKNGFLVKLGNEEELLSKIEYLVNNVESFCKASLETYNSKFTLNKFVEKYLNSYLDKEKL